jgi:hypothetical protein
VKGRVASYRAAEARAVVAEWGEGTARERYRPGERVSAVSDRDGDGTFEQRVEFDRFDMPK